MQLSVLCGSMRRDDRASRTRAVLLLAGQLLGVGLTVLMGLIHLRLWLDGYRQIPIIGTLFIANAVCSAALAAILLTVPVRLRRLAAAVTALFTMGTLAGLILSLTIGLFGMHESVRAPLVPTTLTVESVGVLVLLLMAALPDPRQRRQ
jgi:hypothetical protein